MAAELAASIVAAASTLHEQHTERKIVRVVEGIHRRVEGFTVKGLPRFTMTRGYVAIQEDEVKTREGHGKFVPREPFSPTNEALSKWKALTAPRKVIRDPANMPAGV